MNILKLIESFSNESALGGLTTKGSRRDSFSQFGKMGATAAMAALPFSMLLSQTANAQSTPTTENKESALKLALTLEYLEDEFYKAALNGSFLSAAERIIIEQISKHETAHVNLLKGALGNAAPAKPTFDFTAGGTFPDVMSNSQTFFAVAQAFEDTGVRAYKGQAGNFGDDKATLTIALQIHSVEARHASKIRRYRGLRGWITGNDEGGHPAAADAVYAGENVTTQAGFNTATVTNGSGNPTIQASAGSASFDEPLTTAQATAIASLFIQA